jgi:hypothetical protein
VFEDEETFSVFTLYTLKCTKFMILICFFNKLMNIYFVAADCDFGYANNPETSWMNYTNLITALVCDMSFFLIYTMQVFEWACMIHVILYQKSRKCEEIWFNI